MIRNLLASTAIATLVATGAYAQTTPAPMAPAEQVVPQMKHAEGHLASTIIGQTVYSSAGEEAENIGSVNDLVISPDGDVEAIVVGVGGFLGLGQKNVALEYDLAEWTERDGSEWLVVNTNREALEALPDFDVSAYRPLPADATVGNTKPATAQELGMAAPAGATGTQTGTQDSGGMAAAPEAAPDSDTLAQAPADDEPVAGTDDTRTSAIDRSTLTEAPVGALSADELIGTSVYGANDENVGSIGDVVLSQDGNVDAVVIDVGGFLGIGTKPVAVGMDNLAFMTDGNGGYYLYTPFTQEQLEAQAEYDPSTFAENRDNQLLIIPAQ